MLKISNFLTQVENASLPWQNTANFPYFSTNYHSRKCRHYLWLFRRPAIVGSYKKIFLNWNFQGWQKNHQYNAFLKNCLNTLKRRHSDTKNLKNKIPWFPQDSFKKSTFSRLWTELGSYLGNEKSHLCTIIVWSWYIEDMHSIKLSKKAGTAYSNNAKKNRNKF